MKILSSLILALFPLALILPAKAQAGILIEPWLGYESGKVKCTTVGGSDCGGDVTGMHYGARLGYKIIGGLWFAGEYNGSSGLSTTQPNGNPDLDTEHKSIGATVGFDLLFGLRVFAGYNFVEELETSSPGSSSAKYSGGNSIKFGAGYKFPLIPLAINLEMNTATYKKLETNGIKVDVDTVYSTLKHTGYILSVSAPFDF